jgi:hypothetical protein
LLDQVSSQKLHLIFDDALTQEASTRFLCAFKIQLQEAVLLFENICSPDLRMNFLNNLFFLVKNAKNTGTYYCEQFLVEAILLPTKNTHFCEGFEVIPYILNLPVL